MVILFKTSRSVQLLVQVSSLNPFKSLKADVTRTAYASLICELTMKGFQDGEINPEAFDSSLKALRGIDSGDLPARVILVEYMLELSEALGFGIDPNACPVCGKDPAVLGPRNLFHLDSGAVACSSCHEDGISTVSISGETVGVLRHFKKSLGNLGRLRVSKHAWEELTNALIRHLKYHHPTYSSLPTYDMLSKLVVE
jgi:DNA repair protein RecO (recombination protein O)